MVRDEEVNFIANAAVILKRNSLFTEKMGGILGIITPTAAKSRITLQPKLKLNVFTKYVEVVFNKRGPIETSNSYTSAFEVLNII